MTYAEQMEHEATLNLWAAVIRQACLDVQESKRLGLWYLPDYPAVPGRSDLDEVWRYGREAWSWLYGKGLPGLCNRLGLDPGFVLRRLQGQFDIDPQQPPAAH